MKLVAVERAPAAPQQPVSSEQIEAMCHRAFGAQVEVLAAIELGLGTYNNTYRVEFAGRGPAVLRVAPAPSGQFRIERELMRNEHATTPFLAGVLDLLPRTLTVDFTHQLIGRDYLFQTLLDGLPAPDGLERYPRTQWADFFRQLGAITAIIHSVRGARFGPVGGPTFATWSEALLSYFADAAADLHDGALDNGDIRLVMAAVERHRAVVDEIIEPRLLPGDLWTVNIMVATNADRPTITGICDYDRAWWGDPPADWTIHMARQRPGTEREAFWETYARGRVTSATSVRASIYRARHLAAIRLERLRHGKTGEIRATYDGMRDVLDRL